MTKKSDYSFIAYVDESGDIGINSDKHGSSEWFGIAAFIVPTTNDLSLVAEKKRILSICKINRSDIHMKEITNEDKRRYIAQCVGKLDSKCVVVLSNKASLYGKDTFTTKDSYYQYMSRYLLERITNCCSDWNEELCLGNGKVKIIFATRGGMNYDNLKKYLYSLKNSPEVNKQIKNKKLPKINWDVIDIDQVENMPAEKRVGLQFADVLSYSFFKAVNKNEYGMVNIGYCRFFKTNMYQRMHRIWHNGVTIVNITELKKEHIPKGLVNIFQKSVNSAMIHKKPKVTEKLSKIAKIVKK